MQVAEEIKSRPDYKGVKEAEKAVELGFIPEPVGKEKPYMFELSQECPYDSLSVLGHVSFHKKLHKPSSRSEEIPETMHCVFHLSDNQLEAVKLAAERKKVYWRDGGSLKSKSIIEFITIKELPEDFTGNLISESQLRDLLFKIAQKSSQTKQEKEKGKK